MDSGTLHNDTKLAIDIIHISANMSII